MRKYQNSLLAGVAALALVTGTGFVAAQTMNHNGTSSGGTSGPATESHGGTHSMNGMGQGSTGTGAGEHAQGRGGAGMSAQNPAGTSAQTHGQTQTGGQNRSTQNGSATNGTNQSANENRMNERQNSAQERGLRGQHRNEQQNTAQGNRVQGQRGLRGQPRSEQRNTMQGQRGVRGQPGNEQRNTLQGQRGLQGNAAGQMQGSRRVETSSGRSVQLSQDQRTRIRQTIIESGKAPRVGHVNFDVRTGTVIPRSEFTSIRVVPVPSYLVQIEPRWRGYEYFVYQDRIVIVDPHDLRIVAIVPA